MTKIEFNLNGKNLFVTIKKWEKGSHVRYYITDEKGNQKGYFDAANRVFSWSGSPSQWKDEVEKAVLATLK
jgi:DNA-binding transcriptional regulator GbsR (MarR family)